MPQFKPGNLVQLRSGGPVMTVKGDDTYGEAICTWFDNKQAFQQHSFAHDELKPAEPPDRPFVMEPG